MQRVFSRTTSLVMKGAAVSLSVSSNALSSMGQKENMSVTAKKSTPDPHECFCVTYSYSFLTLHNTFLALKLQLPETFFTMHSFCCILRQHCSRLLLEPYCPINKSLQPQMSPCLH